MNLETDIESQGFANRERRVADGTFPPSSTGNVEDGGIQRTQVRYSASSKEGIGTSADSSKMRGGSPNFDQLQAVWLDCRNEYFLVALLVGLQFCDAIRVCIASVLCLDLVWRFRCFSLLRKEFHSARKLMTNWYGISTCRTSNRMR